MRKAFLLALSAAGPALAGGLGPVFSLSLEKPLGYSWYDLEHVGPEQDTETGTGRPMVRSELNFPLDPFRIAAGWTTFRGTDSAGKAGLRTEIRAWAGVGPAYLRMRDEDWAGTQIEDDEGDPTRILQKFSDTRSRTDAYEAGGGIHRELGAYRLFGVTWVGGIGAGATVLHYDVFGAEGKARDRNGEWVHVEIPASVLALTYRTYTARAVAGLRPRERLLGMEWEARFHPLLYARAFDDHILRKKDIEMECWGAGGALEASVPAGRRGGPGRQVPRLAPYLRAELDRAWGRMQQTYYADSNDSPEDETGQSVHGIRTTVNHWLVAAGIRCNLGI